MKSPSGDVRQFAAYVISSGLGFTVCWKRLQHVAIQIHLNN